MRRTTKVYFLYAMLTTLAISPLLGQAERGGEVSWARLKTDYEHWNRHSHGEPTIVNFIHDHTSLNINPSWQVADINSLETLTNYPFLFSEGIHVVKDPKQQANLREYLLRGGFIFIDSCINPTVNDDPDEFLADQIALIQTLLPEVTWSRLPNDNPIYSIFFKIEGGVPHSYFNSIYDPKWEKHGLYAFYYENRPVALVSLSGLKCGWTGLMEWKGHDVLSSQMMVNIYIWAMTR